MTAQKVRPAVPASAEPAGAAAKQQESTFWACPLPLLLRLSFPQHLRLQLQRLVVQLIRLHPLCAPASREGPWHRPSTAAGCGLDTHVQSITFGRAAVPPSSAGMQAHRHRRYTNVLQRCSSSSGAAHVSSSE